MLHRRKPIIIWEGSLSKLGSRVKSWRTRFVQFKMQLGGEQGTQVWMDYFNQDPTKHHGKSKLKGTFEVVDMQVRRARVRIDATRPRRRVRHAP